MTKAELSILYNLEEFLNLDISRPNAQVVQEIEQRRKQRISMGRKSKYQIKDAIGHFKRNERLKFQDITEAFLRQFKTFCIGYLEHKTRTTTNQLIFIRTLFNNAIVNGHLDTIYYPFGSSKEKIKIGHGHKIGFTSREVEKIEVLKPPENSSIRQTLNIWLVAFYFAGIPISDFVQLRCSDFKDDRLYYTMSKNEKPLSLNVPKKAAKILGKYRKYEFENKGYIFPFLNNVDLTDEEDVFTKTRNATSLCNKYLKRIAEMCGIEKDLTNHIPRHTFGNIAGDRLHPLMLQKLYGF